MFRIQIQMFFDLNKLTDKEIIESINHYSIYFAFFSRTNNLSFVISFPFTKVREKESIEAPNKS
jgi:hypothetical protein